MCVPEGAGVGISVPVVDTMYADGVISDVPDTLSATCARLGGPFSVLSFHPSRAASIVRGNALRP